MRELSPDTQAVLLLCARFGDQREAAAEPLTQTEYGRLVQWLRERQLRPAELLTPAAVTLLAEAPYSARLCELLQRGAALALATTKWLQAGLWILSRSDAGYPRRLKQRLGQAAPPILFGAGDASLLETGGLAIVGSRAASEQALEFTRAIATRCAQEGIAVLSGGARGVDTAAMQNASGSGGYALGVLADGLLRASLNGRNRAGILAGRLVLVSPFNPEAGFNAGNAMARNRYIYALADYALVVQTDLNKGGTWSGATENLRMGWVPLLVRNDAGLAGNQALIEKGGEPFTCDVRNGFPLREYLSQATAGKQGKPGGQTEEHAGLFPGVAAPTAYLTLPTARETGTAPPYASLDLFEVFCQQLQHILKDNPRTSREIQECLGLESTQARVWLERAQQQEVVVKLTRPARFALPREQRLF